MIGFLRGVLLDKQPPDLVIDVGGVGYELQASMTTIFALPAAGEQVQVYTHLVVREDAQVLYGFKDLSERALFRQLLKVNGVGAKLALAILSGMSAGEFARCVADGDVASLVRLPGIGKKTAERLMVEMRDRLERSGLLTQADAALPSVGVGEQNSARQEAVYALVALGYKEADALKRVRAVADGSVEQMIRAVLKGGG